MAVIPRQEAVRASTKTVAGRIEEGKAKVNTAEALCLGTNRRSSENGQGGGFGAGIEIS